MNSADLKAELKDLAAIMPKDANENQLRSVAQYVKLARHYIERIIQSQDNRLARRAMREIAAKKETAAQQKARNDKRKLAAEIELAKVDPPREGEVKIVT
jgi:hypothetical protein